MNDEYVTMLKTQAPLVCVLTENSKAHWQRVYSNWP